MNFQDRLKEKMKTPDELHQIEIDKTIKMAQYHATLTMDCVRNKLIECAENGEYIISENGESVISITVPPQPDYYWLKSICSTGAQVIMSKPKEGDFSRWFTKNIRAISSAEDREIRKMAFQQAQIYGKNRIKKEQEIYIRLRGEYGASSPPIFRTVFSMSSEFRNVYCYYRDKVLELASQDNIEMHFCLSVGDELFDLDELPLAIDRETDDNLWGRLVIQCKCLIPEKFSSDNVIVASDINKNEFEQTENDTQINIDVMDGLAFESFCADLLKRVDYQQVSVTSGSGDQGIDIIAYKDGVKFGIQCKRYNSDIGNRAVQEAFAGKQYYDCNVGVVLTNRYFTRSAKDLAQRNGIVLWGRDELLSFMKKAGYTLNSSDK